MERLALLSQRLPRALADAVRALGRSDAQHLQEIRIYAGSEPEFVISGEIRTIPIHIPMQELLCCLSAQALYSCERQMAEGYIPLPGGHRAGVCGSMACDQDGTWRMTGVSSVCIRIARSVRDVSGPVRPFLLDRRGNAQRVLVLGAPGSGKTTLLRDAALWLSQKGMHVAVADEREELFAGVDMQQRGRLNVLSGVEKARAFSMLLRSMAPQVIVSDEIGCDADVHAVLDCVRCGVGLLLSAHAASMEEAASRPAIRRLLLQRAFDWYVLLGRRAQAVEIYNSTGNRWEGNGNGQLGCGGDGDDCRQHSGISAFGW